jgi:hypothetical protein
LKKRCGYGRPGEVACRMLRVLWNMPSEGRRRMVQRLVLWGHAGARGTGGTFCRLGGGACVRSLLAGEGSASGEHLLKAMHTAVAAQGGYGAAAAGRRPPPAVP